MHLSFTRSSILKLVTIATVASASLLLAPLAAYAAITGTATPSDSQAGVSGVAYTVAFDTTNTNTASVITIVLPNGYSIDNDVYSGSTELRSVICDSGCTHNGLITVGSNSRAVDNIIVTGRTVTINLSSAWDLSSGSGVVFTLKTSMNIQNPTSTGSYIWTADSDATSEVTTNLTGTTINPNTEGCGIEDCDSPELLFSTEPSATPNSGSTFSQQPVVTAYDSFGNVDTSFTGLVTLSTFDGTGSLGGTLSVHAVSGVATFTGISYTVGTGGTDHEFVGLDADASGYDGTSTSFLPNVTATHFIIGSITPSDTTGVGTVSGSTMDLLAFAAGTNDVVDTDYSSNASTTASGAGALAGGAPAAFSDGSHTFTLSYTATVDHQTSTLTVDDGPGGFSPVTSSSITFDVVATHLTFDTLPGANFNSNNTFTVVARARDDNNVVDIDYVGNVSLSEDGEGSLSGTTNMHAVSGVASFTGLTYTPVADGEEFNLTASGDDISDAVAGLSSDVVATKLVITDVSTEADHPNGDVQSGGAFDVTVEAENANGIIDSDYDSGSHAITLTCSASSNCFSPVTFTIEGGEGVASGVVFNAGEDHESFTITASDTGDHVLGASSGDNLTADVVATQLNFTDLPGSVTGGVAFSISISAIDDNSVVDTDDDDVVSVDLGDGAGSLTANAITLSEGEGSEDVTYYAGTDGEDFTIVISAEGFGDVETEDIPANVVATGFNVYVTSDEEGPIIAGEAATLSIVAVDGDGATDTSFDPSSDTFSLKDSDANDLSTHLSPNESAPSLPSSADIVEAFSDGQASVPITFTNAEEFNLVVNDADRSGSADVSVQHQDASSAGITLDTESPTTGSAADYTVTVYDQFGNIMGSDQGADPFVGDVQVSTDATDAAINHQFYTFVEGDNGAKTFTGGITFHDAEDSVHLIVLSSGLDGDTSDPFDVTAASEDLAINGVDLTKSVATKDDSYADGWQWTITLTVPTAETQLQMSFDDFTGPGELGADNIQFYSPQSDHGSGNPIAITDGGAGSAWSDPITLTGDSDDGAIGRQVQIIVQAKVPSDTVDGSYSTSFGVQTNVPPLSVVIHEPVDTVFDWTPDIDWGTAVVCSYSFDNDVFNTVDCSAGGSDIPAPDAGPGTLYLHAADSEENEAVESSVYTYVIPG